MANVSTLDIIEEKSNPFLVAAYRRDFAAMKSRLDAGESINQHGYIVANHESGGTFLPFSEASAIVIAMELRDLRLLKFIMENGGKAHLEGPNNGARPHGRVPMETAAAHDFLEGILYLRDDCAAPLWPFKDTPAEELFSSALSNQNPGLRVFKYLIEVEKLDCFYRDPYTGQDLVYLTDHRHACAEGYLDIQAKQNDALDYLLKAGLSPDTEHVQKCCGMKVVFETPEAKKAFDAEDDAAHANKMAEIASYDTTRLIHSAFWGKLDRVNILLANGANPLLADRYNHTPLKAVRAKSGYATPMNASLIETAIREIIAARHPTVQPLARPRPKV